MADRTVKILIIDDESYIRESIKHFFEDYGYNVIEADGGKQGLKVFEKIKPDIVLCDLLMPGMNGLEVLGIITKRCPGTPIIIISGTGNIADTVEALRLGAWDYIMKPIQDMNVLYHAVTKGLERAAFIREREQYQKDLENANTELKNSLEILEKTRDKLVQAEKMSALVELVAGVAHEINTPVGIGVTGSSFLHEKTRKIRKIYDSGELKRSELESYLHTMEELSLSILINMEKAGDLISSFKQIAVDQSTETKREFNLKKYIEGILLSLRPSHEGKDHDIEIICPENINIYSYPGAYSSIITNLVINSLVHGFKNIKKGKISFNITRKKNMLRLVYKDDGNGMTKEQVSKIFNPFYTTTRGKGGTGLGMSIVFNLITQTLKGTIICKSTLGQGAVFVIEIPESCPEFGQKSE